MKDKPLVEKVHDKLGRKPFVIVKDVKEHTDRAKKRLKESHEKWRKKGVIGEFFDDSFKYEIDKIWKEEIGEFK